jgi:hypothetical protein
MNGTTGRTLTQHHRDLTIDKQVVSGVHKGSISRLTYYLCLRPPLLDNLDFPRYIGVSIPNRRLSDPKASRPT